MSMTMEEEFKRWTAQREAALVTEIIQGKTSLAEASRAFDIPPNDMVKRVIRTLKKQCVHRHRFETLQDASRVIAD